ncbi:hypothetical protein FKM82_018026 [Ascaphus truei]
MAPESAAPGRGVTSGPPTLSSSDSDSGCALEEYPDLEARPSAVTVAMSSGDAQELNLIRTLLQLLPPQDCDERFCTALGEQERRELQTFSAHRRLHCMRRGVIIPATPGTPDSCCVRQIKVPRVSTLTCVRQCGGRIAAGDTAVGAGRAQEEGLRWHLSCFVCDTCRHPLEHFIYFAQDGRIYCGRHHAELSRARCAACDQLILSESCIVAEGHRWHVEHFRCWECEEVLGGCRYVMKGGRPFCSHCFLRLHAENCEACGDPINPDGDLVTHRGQYWHALPACFCCSRCGASLQGSEFTVDNGHLYCPLCCSPCESQDHHPHGGVMGTPPTALTPSNGSSSHLHCGHQDHTAPPGGRSTMRLSPSLQDSPPVTSSEEGSPGPLRGTAGDIGVPRLTGHCEGAEEEDTSCSSSDSEPEGFFLGKPIPNYSIPGRDPSSACGKRKSLKRWQRGKNCKVS